MGFYSQKDRGREAPITPASGFDPEPYRSEFRRDYARLVHSPSFRRLCGKTQLYPGQELDFFRNRLTHSLEVAQIAKSIAIKLNHTLKKEGAGWAIDLDLIEFAGLAHDLGHPPFGHIGESALDACMTDFGGFEGNAQTLRILTRLEKRQNDSDFPHCINPAAGIDSRVGLNLTYRSLSAIVKYDYPIPAGSLQRKDAEAEGRIKDSGVVKGYYATEDEIVKRIRHAVLGKSGKPGGLYTIECQIMDIADDIAYSTYDLEDAFKAGFMSPMRMISASDDIIDEVARKVTKSLSRTVTSKDVKQLLLDVFSDLFLFDKQPLLNESDPEKLKEIAAEVIPPVALRHGATASEMLKNDGYIRTGFTSRQVGRFIRSISLDQLDKSTPALSTIKMLPDIHLKLEVLKQMNFVTLIQSPRLQIVDYRGREIVSSIFKSLFPWDKPSEFKDDNPNLKLLPRDFKAIYLAFKKPSDRARVVCDFVAGMTDRYALEFYGRLKSENPETIFKPI